MTPPNYSGLSLIPCRADKRPVAAWKPSQSAIIPPANADAYGVVCGAISGNLECIDYDRKADPNADVTWEAFREIVEATAPYLWPRLTIQRTISGGHHIIYRCPAVKITGNKKLACPDGLIEAIFETRGEGGFFIVAPSEGYTLVQGDFNDVQRITADERELLMRVAESFGSLPKTEPDVIIADRAHASATSGFIGGLSPLDDYDVRGDALALLNKNGWRVAYELKGTSYLTRPGKTHGVSATYNYAGSNRLYVFSSSTNFQQGRSYKPSSIYGMVVHGSDFHKAARQLISEGYGLKSTQREVIKIDVSQHAWKGDHGDAALLGTLLKNKSVWDASTEKYYIFDSVDASGHWHVDLGGGILNLSIELLVAAYQQALEKANEQAAAHTDIFTMTANSDRNQSEKARNKANANNTTADMLTKRITALRQVKNIESVLKLTKRYITIHGNEWDRDPMILGVPNGVIDLTTGDLRAAEPHDYVRRIAATKYDPTATAPRFAKFLLEIFGNEATIASYMIRLLGYGLTGKTTEHVYPILWGADGRNGKDTLLDVLFRTLGTSIAKPVSPDTVISSGKRNTGAATPELFDLYGARLVWINETEESAIVKASQLKALSGGTIIKCRPLHGNLVEFEPTHLMLLVTNYKPQVPSHDNALWERVHLIPFSERFIDEPTKPNEHKVDRKLGAVLASERAGILRTLVEGCLEWQKCGLEPPLTICDDTKAYRRESDFFADWYGECLELVTSQTTKGALLYNSYKNWCVENGYYPSSHRMLAIRLKQAGHELVKVANSRHYIGLALRVSQTAYFSQN